MKTAAVFIDRDGVLNSDPGYINNPQDLHPYPFAFEAVRNFNQMGLKVIVVTNQSGIARGLLSLNELQAIHQKLIADFAAQKAVIDKIYFSPYHIDGHLAPYNIEHEDRKPDIGMFKKACLDFDLDPGTSFMIGDRRSDMIFAHRANITPILVLTGDGKKDYIDDELYRQKDIAPRYVAQDILAASWLISDLIKDR
ncbi:MAG: HAD family hydrolase [Candidatus Cloacimonetes bacterium]|nr:HAD family hydrolase [Candidatus Cloacimonadota bacterium]